MTAFPIIEYRAARYRAAELTRAGDLEGAAVHSQYAAWLSDLWSVRVAFIGSPLDFAEIREALPLDHWTTVREQALEQWDSVKSWSAFRKRFGVAQPAVSATNEELEGRQA